MAEIVHRFDDGAAYERFMGRWTRAVGEVFLDWAAVPLGLHWLDVGCGTGVFTELVFDKCFPAAMTAIDPAQAQIEHARRRPIAQRATFSVADAQALPSQDGSFDVVASALVINFVHDREQALSEMRRVARADGFVIGYVWDLEAERSPSWPLRRGLREMGVDVPQSPGNKDSTVAALISLFERAGLVNIATTSIEVTLPFSSFDDFWQAQTPSYSPISKVIAVMTPDDRAKLIETVGAGFQALSDGRIEYSARANAVKARVPA